MRHLALGLALLLAAAALAGAEERPALSDADAIALERLHLQRQVLDERARRLEAEVRLTELLRAQAAVALDTEIRAAAARAGVDPERLRPDLGSRTWVAR